MTLSRYLTPAIWLIVPIMAMNVGFATYLPEAFQPDVFKAGIPAWITLPENALRIALFTLMAFLPLTANRLGWAVFLVGTAVYAAAWAAQILLPGSVWSGSAIGFTAPAWTPAIWLAGIGMVSGRPLFSDSTLWRVAYWLLMCVFLATHISHTALVWTRLP